MLSVVPFLVIEVNTNRGGIWILFVIPQQEEIWNFNTLTTPRVNIAGEACYTERSKTARQTHRLFSRVAAASIAIFFTPVKKRARRFYDKFKERILYNIF